MNNPKPNAYLPLITQPDLYRRNGFRLAELPVEAGSAELARRQQVLALSQATGLTAPPGPCRALPLLDASDISAVDDAIQALHDPEQRLLYELFWFWPQEAGQSRDDRALQALAQGQVAEAMAIWQSQQEQDGVTNIPLHNLAVLTHALALDLEHTATRQSLTEAQSADLTRYWEQALGLWRALLAADPFWEQFAQRAAGLGDPRLTASAVAHIRQTLPAALLSINAQLAISAARANELSRARQQVDRLRNAGFEAASVDQVLRQASAPLRQQINAQAAAAEREADGAPQRGAEVTQRLLDQSRPLLATVDLLLPWGHSSRTQVHDEVAQRALNCLIPFGNRTEQWRVVQPLLTSVQEVAEGNALIKRLTESLQTVEDNLLYDTCWFCGQAPGGEGAGITYKLHGNVRRTPAFVGFNYGWRLEWNTRTITVPRCFNCEAIHAQKQAPATSGWVAGLLVGFLVWLFVQATAPSGAVWLALLAGCAAWGVVDYHASQKEQLNTQPKPAIRAESESVDFPPLRLLLRQGWGFGERPPEAR